MNYVLILFGLITLSACSQATSPPTTYSQPTDHDAGASTTRGSGSAPVLLTVSHQPFDWPPVTTSCGSGVYNRLLAGHARFSTVATTTHRPLVMLWDHNHINDPTIDRPWVALYIAKDGNHPRWHCLRLLRRHTLKLGKSIGGVIIHFVLNPNGTVYSYIPAPYGLVERFTFEVTEHRAVELSPTTPESTVARRH